MKTTTTHISNFGAFVPGCPADQDGYIRYHVSKKYDRMTTSQLQTIAEDQTQLQAIRNASAIALAQDELAEWQSR